MSSPGPAMSEGGAPAKSLGASGYWDVSQRPLVCLLFLLPLIVAYEVGTARYTSAAQHGGRQHIIAFDLLRDFFSLFRATSRHMPALALASILLWWHVFRRDPWTFPFSTIAGMMVEALLLAVPVLSIGFALSHYFPLAAGGAVPRDLLIFSLGAGIYEEFIFRLILLTFLSLILRDAFQVEPNLSSLLMVVTSGILFAAYHYLSPHESFQLKTFAFRTLAGAYFATLFLTRGFGITAFSHAAYDVLIILIAARVPQ